VPRPSTLTDCTPAPSATEATAEEAHLSREVEAPILVDHPTDLRASTGGRGFCWRRACRQANGGYRTVTYERGLVVVARCHRGSYRSLFDLVVELYEHAG
jgi:hypothetical protein